MENKKVFLEKYGEWALITGGSSGIGKALAFEIASKGLNLILVARGQQGLELTSFEIKKKYRVSVTTIQADLSTKEGINKVIKETELLEVGFLVLSAGIENNGLFTKNSIEKELQVIQLNVVSTMMLTHHFVKKMVEIKRGGILFVASLTAHIPSPYFSNYAGTKSYVLNFGNSLYGELLAKGVNVSILSPGVTTTPMSNNTGIDWSKTPVKEMSPEVVAEEAIRYFGKRLSIVPGKPNKVVAFIFRKIFSFTKASLQNEKMLRNAMDASKL